jgi:hypothetical protein
LSPKISKSFRVPEPADSASKEQENVQNEPEQVNKAEVEAVVQPVHEENETPQVVKTENVDSSPHGDEDLKKPEEAVPSHVKNKEFEEEEKNVRSEPGNVEQDDLSQRLAEDAKKVCEMIKHHMVEEGGEKVCEDDMVKKQFEELATTGSAITEQESNLLVNVLAQAEENPSDMSTRSGKHSVSSSVDERYKQENMSIGVFVPERTESRTKAGEIRRSKTFCGKIPNLNKWSGIVNQKEEQKNEDINNSENVYCGKSEQKRKTNEKSKDVQKGRKELLQEAIPRSVINCLLTRTIRLRKTYCVNIVNNHKALV